MLYVPMNTDVRTVRCRACDAEQLSPRYQVNGYQIAECLACSSMVTLASMPPCDASAYYGYSYYHGGDYDDYEAAEPNAKRNFLRFASRLEAIGPSGRLLEIGCAYGFFLDVAAVAWDVDGIDISREAVAACRARFGSRVQCGDLPDVPLADGQFDWVVAWDTIEHVDRPKDHIRRAFALLKPGAHLALTTGDISSLAARCSGSRWRLLTPPSHLTFFSRRGMRLLLAEAGFTNVRISTVGYERSLAFTLFRLLGPARLLRAKEVAARLGVAISWSYYINLGDVMFVSAMKP